MIIPYHPEHKADLLNIFKRSIPTYFDPSELEKFERYLDSEGEHFNVVLYQNKVVGGGGQQYHEGNQNGYITWLLIDPELHGRGFGKELTEHSLAVLRSDERVKKLIVRTSQFAYKFFERMGFQLQYTKDDYWGKGIHLYFMEQEV